MFVKNRYELQGSNLLDIANIAWHHAFQEHMIHIYLQLLNKRGHLELHWPSIQLAQLISGSPENISRFMPVL